MFTLRLGLSKHPAVIFRVFGSRASRRALWCFYRVAPKVQPILRGMKKTCKYFLLGLVPPLLLLLSSCSGGFSAAPYSFDVQIDPNPLSIDVVSAEPELVTVEVPTHVLRFASKAGAVGATVEGYDVYFYEASDNPAFPGDSIQRSSGSLSIYVPPGIYCDQLVEDITFDGCTINSPGATFRRGPVRPPLGQTVDLPQTTIIPLDIARQLYRLVGIGGAVGAYAEIYFYGTDDLQRPFRSEPYQVAIVIN